MAKPTSMKESLPGLWGLLRYLAPYIRKQRMVLAGSFGALFTGVAMRALEPWPLKLIFDHILLPPEGGVQGAPAWLADLQPLGMLVLAASMLLIIILLRATSHYYEKVGFALVGNRVLTEVRGALFRHIQCLSMSFHNRSRSGDLLVRVMGDIGMLREVSVVALMPLIGNVLVLLVMGGLMLWMNWKLALVVMISAPLYWLTTLHFGRRIQHVSRKQRQREGKMAAGTMEMIGAMQVVKTLTLEDAFAQVTSQDQKNLKEGVRFRRLLARLTGTVQVMMGLSTAAVLFYGTYLVMQGELTAGSLLVFLSYLKAVFKPLQNFSKYSGRIARASAAGERVIELFETEPEVRDIEGAVPAPPLQGSVRFEGVSFEYEPGHAVLQNIDLAVEPGRMVALLGESGAGKSTLVEMLPRLHDPTSGRVLIDGTDVKQFTLASLRSQVAFVLQDPLLFATTIRENIAFGLSGASDEQVIQAAKLAQAHDFIMKQPDGYDTVVGERGVTLSAGQKQRIAVARAAISPAPILVLDEPTTGLDEENRTALLDALAALTQGRTTFLITQDRTEAARADLVLYLEKGAIALSGDLPSVWPAHQGPGRQAGLESP